MAKVDMERTSTLHDCGEPMSYNLRFDSDFCIKCDVWLNIQCGDEECYYCVDRSEKPSQTEE
jgi:hypothetical protein